MNRSLRTSTERNRLRRRSYDPAFFRAWTNLKNRADEAVRTNLRPATEGAGWGHGYYCPEHAVALQFNPGDPYDHRCPTGGERHSGPTFDAGWRCVLNGRILDGLVSCSQVWQATCESPYRDHAIEIISEYADIYPDLPPHGDRVGHGRVTGQSLEEAVWGIRIAQAYDDLRGSLDPTQQERIETNLLYSIGAHVKSQLMLKVHNIECWHLASLATLGVVLDEPAFVDPVRTGEYGLFAQLDAGVRADGWWVEGSAHYHLYMLQSVVHTVLALRHEQPELLSNSMFRKMLVAPFTLMRSDFSLPALNDGWAHISEPYGMKSYAGLYEQAFGVWGEQDCGRFLRGLYASGVPRDGEAALSMGPDLSEVEPGTIRNPRRIQSPSGYAVLADGSGEGERNLLMKFGPHGGGHGHPDKLQLDLHAYGVRLAPDPGSPAYSSPLQFQWFRQTLAHNTVLLGEQSQPEGEGQLLADLSPDASGAGLVDASVSWPLTPDPQAGTREPWLKETRCTHIPAYAGAMIRRSVLWKILPRGYYIDLVFVHPHDDVAIDLAWHHRGKLTRPEATTLHSLDWHAPGATFTLIDDVRVLAEAGREEPVTWSAQWNVEGAGTQMWGLDPPGSHTLAATAPSSSPATRQPMLLRRSHGLHKLYASVIEPFSGESGTLRSVSWDDRGLMGGRELVVSIEHDRGNDTWEIATSDAVPNVGVQTTNTGSTYRVNLPHLRHGA